MTTIYMLTVSIHDNLTIRNKIMGSNGRTGDWNAIPFEMREYGELAFTSINTITAV